MRLMMSTISSTKSGAKPRLGSSNKRSFGSQAGYLSGGEHQMRAIRRALMTVMGEAQPHTVGRTKRQQVLAGERDLAFGHLAALRSQQTADRFQRRALARAVGAEEGDQPSLGHIDRNALD